MVEVEAQELAYAWERTQYPIDEIAQLVLSFREENAALRADLTAAQATVAWLVEMVEGVKSLLRDVQDEWPNSVEMPDWPEARAILERIDTVLAGKDEQ